MSFAGRKVVVAGAYGGVASELSRRLSGKGAQLLLLGRDAVRLQALALELNAQHAVVDVSQVEAVEAAVAGFGPIDGLANCAGSLLLKPAHITTDAEWQSTMQANLGTAFAALRAAVKSMPAGGSIVLISSAAARIGLANHEAIAAAKAGVVGLTLAAAATYSNRNIRVNCVAPGLVDTPLTARLTANDALLKASQSMHPLGRIGRPGDIAAAIEFLLDPDNSWVTGQCLGVDGGLGSVRGRA